MPAQVIFGDIREHNAEDLRAALRKADINRIDTAARYGNGESEKKIGAAGMAQDFIIDTKVLFTSPDDRTLSSEAIEKSIKNSLDVLKVQQVNVLYCHAPDWNTPIAEQAKAFDDQYRLGRFKHLGVSNFPPSMVEEWLSIASENNYVKPTYYEGQYNPICRGFETTLFPLLRKNNIHFTAFSPVAGGFLLGRGARMSNSNNPFAAWYDKRSMHAAVAKLRELSESTELGMDELSLRWLKYHSALGDNDAIILGASKLEQIGNNVGQMNAGPLGADVVDAMNGLWEICKEDGMAIVKLDK